MKCEHYFYNCSKDYINSIDSTLYNTITEIIDRLPKRATQAEINNDMLLEFIVNNWSYDSMPKDLSSNRKINNKRSLCLTSQTLNSNWHCDFAKQFAAGIVQVEVQFGKVELMFKDFCGFKIASTERRLLLGIEIVMLSPNEYFEHRKKAISGMAYFDIAKQTLPIIGLECPIWLIGLSE